MSHVHTRTKILVVALLAACGVALACAGAASAAKGAGGVRIIGKPASKAAISSCTLGEFCGWRHAGKGGGLYHFSGTDRNLFNDRFGKRACLPNKYDSQFLGAWNDRITGYFWTDCDGRLRHSGACHQHAPAAGASPSQNPGLDSRGSRSIGRCELHNRSSAGSCRSSQGGVQPPRRPIPAPAPARRSR